MKKTTGSFDSASGLCRVRYYAYSPEKPKALVMLSHGMCEYIERYEPFARYLCDRDIALIGNDHIGHGGSVTDAEMLGFFGEDRGYIHMIRDMHRLKLIARQKFPDIPHFLMGHSMGSFLARIYISKYADEWRGAVFLGTAGGVVGSAPLRRAMELISRGKSGRYRHTLGTKLAFGVFNLRTENHRTPLDWLSRDEASVDRFIADPKCNFTFTTDGYKDLLNALLCCNSKPVIENTPTDLPLLFLSGSMDPIGQYGAGVSAAVEKYRECGCDATLKLYREARHELLFELNREEVKADIAEFVLNTPRRAD